MPETRNKNVSFATRDAVSVSQQQDGERLNVLIAVQGAADCVLHWGLGGRRPGAWHRPPESCWPQGTTAAGEQAVRTALFSNGDGRRQVVIQLDQSCPWRSLLFVVYFPRENRWLKDGGKDFCIPLSLPPGGRPSLEQALSATTPEAVAFRDVLGLDSGDRLAAAAWSTPEGVRVRLICDAESPVVLHWGLARALHT